MLNGDVRIGPSGDFLNNPFDQSYFDEFDESAGFALGG